MNHTVSIIFLYRHRCNPSLFFYLPLHLLRLILSYQSSLISLYTMFCVRERDYFFPSGLPLEKRQERIRSPLQAITHSSPFHLVTLLQLNSTVNPFHALTSHPQLKRILHLKVWYEMRIIVSSLSHDLSLLWPTSDRYEMKELLLPYTSQRCEINKRLVLSNPMR